MPHQRATGPPRVVVDRIEARYAVRGRAPNSAGEGLADSVPSIVTLPDGRARLLVDMTAPVLLHTDRLTLRPFQDSDVEDALSYRDDREFAWFLPHIPQPFTRRDAEAFVALNISEPWERSATFAVVRDGTLIGTVNFEVGADTRMAMLGYAIGRAWWGQGLATEAARAAIAWAIDSFSLIRVWASTDARHIRSRRVLERLGMQQEALRLGDHIGRDGAMADEVVYGLNLGGSGRSTAG